MTRTGVVGWTLAAPALAVIGVFFAVPVVMGFALSLTDFDLYALADLSTLRFVGLDNYLRLLQTPLFWQALATRSISSPSACRCPSACRWAPPCC
jgi:ABC-type sugar transport systems, permease components